MKKRMFITTIVMMLVLAVALTTSSLAWFSSSNQSVTASSATFTAKTKGSNVNLKIGRGTSGWDNKIALTSGSTDGSMLPYIPTAAIVPTYDGDSFVWNPTISFNGASVAESKFVIDSVNTVDNPTVARGGSNGYYYDYFYIHNADAQTSISELSFKVTSSTEVPENSGETTCRVYAAIILFKSVSLTAGETVPANAAMDAGKELVNNDDPGANEINIGDGTYTAWVPFAAFTYSESTASYKWQYADFDGETNYNGADVSTLETQKADSNFSIEGSADEFKLNTESLRALNNKAFDTDSGESDETSTFSMSALETFRVDFYYWFDGETLDEYKDTTKGEVSIEISAPTIS